MQAERMGQKRREALNIKMDCAGSDAFLVQRLGAIEGKDSDYFARLRVALIAEMEKRGLTL